MVGASKRFTAESGNKNRNAKRNRSEAGRIGDHFLYGMSGDLALEFVGRADCEGLHLLGSNRLTSPDGDLRGWCVCLGMGAGRGRYGREEVHRPGFPGVPRTPRQLLPPVDRWVPPMSCLHPAVLPSHACLTETSDVLSRQVNPFTNPHVISRIDLGQPAKLRAPRCYPMHFIWTGLMSGAGIVHGLTALAQR